MEPTNMESTNVNKEDKKLEWMYKDSSQIVDPEEYLLGRKVDKQFEKNVAGVSSEKDQECLPSSMFIGLSTGNQVDAARKLQEDPLFLIKKREIESREQLLKNPRKLKQLQEMVAKQQAEAKKLEKKRLKKQIKKKNKDIDELLAKKCKKMFGGLDSNKLAALESSCENSSSSDIEQKKKKKKKKQKKDLDKVLGEKYKKLVGSINLKQVSNELSSSTSDTEESYENVKLRRKRSTSTSSNDERSYNKGKSNNNKSDKRYRSYKSQKDKYSSYEELNKTSSLHEKLGSSEPGRSHVKQGVRKVQSKHDKEKHKQYENESDDSFVDKKHSAKDGHKSVRRKHDQEYKHRNERNNKYRASSDISDSGNVKDVTKKKEILKRKNKLKEYDEDSSSSSSLGRTSKKDRTHSKRDIPIKKRARKQSQSPCTPSSGSDDSSNEKKNKQSKHYGLVLPANYKPKEKSIEDKSASKQSEKTVKEEVIYKEPKLKLTDEEKERKLKEMMDNAKWRDDLRDKNIKSYKENEKAEKDNYTYNEEFMRNQMSYAVSQGTVESRVKANINTIQRSKRAMDENFARRK